MAAPFEGKQVEEEEYVNQFASLDIFESDCLRKTRETCERCKRPLTVCWCPFLPNVPITIKSTIYVLQHPFEESRCLRTVPILQNCVSSDNCQVIRGKRFSQKRFPHIVEVLQSPNTFLLFPGKDAEDIADLPTDQTYNIVLLDGTWTQAKEIYTQNPLINTLKKVQIRNEQKSKYVTRTQPCDSFLSTLETAAAAIAALERKPDLYELLTRPLEALCRFQLDHGAVLHQSRQSRLENGPLSKPSSCATRKQSDEQQQEQEQQCSLKSM